MVKTIVSIHEEIKNIVDQTIDDIKHQINITKIEYDYIDKIYFINIEKKCIYLKNENKSRIRSSS